MQNKSKTTKADELIALGFRLGGSRRMAQKYPEQVIIKDETDYDLYCPNEPEFIEAMKVNGFAEVDCKHHTLVALVCYLVAATVSE